MTQTMDYKNLKWNVMEQEYAWWDLDWTSTQIQEVIT